MFNTSVAMVDANFATIEFRTRWGRRAAGGCRASLVIVFRRFLTAQAVSDGINTFTVCCESCVFVYVTIGVQNRLLSCVFRFFFGSVVSFVVSSLMSFCDVFCSPFFFRFDHWHRFRVSCCLVRLCLFWHVFVVLCECLRLNLFVASLFSVSLLFSYFHHDFYFYCLIVGGREF